MDLVTQSNLDRLQFSKLELWNVVSVQNLLHATIDELHEGSIWTQRIKDQYSLDNLVGLIDEEAACCPVALDAQGAAVALGIGRQDGGLGTISWIVVEPKIRGRGLGSLILDNLLDYFKKTNCHRVELKTYLNNEEAMKFYKDRDFRLAAALPNHKFGVDIAYMIRDFNVKELRS